jgi:hypothetical protein
MMDCARLTRAAVTVALLAGCGSATEPEPRPPFLAIVTKLEEGTALDSTATYTYRVRNLSAGTTPLDTMIRATPADTVILSLPASTYSVLLDSLPPKCNSRRGNEEVLVLDPQTNTGLARFLLFCHASLTVAVTTQGPSAASEYVWEVSGGAGLSRSGIVDATGAASADGLPAGDYRVRLALVSPGCLATNSGGLSQRVTVPAEGGVTVRFRIICSDPATAPVVRDFRWSYHDSTAAFVATITDPDRNVANYTFDLTDCAGASVLPGGPVFLDHLDAGRTARLDSLVVLGAIELGLTAAEAAGRCASFRTEDLDGNTSAPVERPLVDAPGAPPAPTAFNALLNGETLLHVVLTVGDPDGDFVGTFAQLRLRDGSLRPPDGVDDLVDYVPQGLLGAALPDVPLGSRFLFTDVYAVIVYLIDAQGHFLRLEDPDTFQ